MERVISSIQIIINFMNSSENENAARYNVNSSLYKEATTRIELISNVISNTITCT